MRKRSAFRRITGALAFAALPATVLAQTTPAGQPQLDEIIVLAKRVNARNRVDTPAPTLSYDEEFFQRFEPISVGDMMKRVPGVVFADDIGEYAAPSLRGIGTEYTQVLVNGRRITGGTNDYVFAPASASLRIRGSPRPAVRWSLLARENSPAALQLTRS